MGYKSRMKKAVKEVRQAVGENSTEKASLELRKAISIIQKNASKKVIHRKKAARKISRLARQVNQVQSA
jgi:small subunit ribosomal protein S20